MLDGASIGYTVVEGLELRAPALLLRELLHWNLTVAFMVAVGGDQMALKHVGELNVRVMISI